MQHAPRRQRVRELVAEAAEGSGDDGQPPWFLVTDPVHVRYLSGFSGSNGQVLIGPTADTDRLITDARYADRGDAHAPGLAIELSRDPVGVALEAASAGDTLAAEADHLTWHGGDELRRRAAVHDVQVVGTTGLVAELRTVKDAEEIARLAAAGELTATALAWLFEQVVAVGVSERDLATALERRFVDIGADGVAFPSIVASGPNAAVPHHAPTDRRLRAGDVLTVDCGAVVDGYHADLTRTVALGRLDTRLRDVHDLVRRAQAAGCEAAVAGASAGDVDRAAREVIDGAGLGERFVHGTGHGVGLQIHEAPAVAREAPATLLPGTALTVEPGVYLPGVGGVRIEDTIVVTADGAPRTLTDLPHELRVL